MGCSTWVDPNYTLLKIKQTTLVYLNLTNFFKRNFLKKIIQKINPDIVHTHLGDASRIMSKSWGNFKLVATCHMNYKKKHYNNHDGIILLNKTQEEIVKEQFSNKIHFIKVDGGIQTLIIQDQQVLHMPTFILYKEGKEVWRAEGILEEKEMEAAIKKQIN